MKYEEIKEGYTGNFTLEITEERNKEFGDLIGDHNPVHFDSERMKKSIFGKRATNGFLTETTIGSAIVKMFADDNNMPIVYKKEIRLLAPVFIGDTITSTVKVKEKKPEKERLGLECEVKKQDGTVVVKANFYAQILPI